MERGRGCGCAGEIDRAVKQVSGKKGTQNISRGKKFLQHEGAPGEGKEGTGRGRGKESSL